MTATLAENSSDIGSQHRARHVTVANSKICVRKGWQGDLALCRWLLGWLTR